MSYWEAKLPLLINKNIGTTLLSSPVVIIDGGSRNALFPPANKIVKNAVVYAFDPSPQPNEYLVPIPVTHIPFALWDKTGTVELHVAKKLGTSSIYPPNYEKLKKFNSRIGWEARKTIEKIVVPSKSIDDAVNEGICQPPDLIKLDIHSAEYEALIGSDAFLEHASMVLVETWHHPIHEGQHLHGELETFLNTKGFYLWDIKKASVWKPLYEGKELAGRAMTIGTESVFVKESGGDLTKKLMLLDMFRFYPQALDIVDILKKQEALSVEQYNEIKNFIIRKSHKEARNLKHVCKNFLKRIFKFTI